MSHTPLNTPLCDLLGCEYPLIQTAMGWIADARLVAATCNAGAFGFLAGAVMSPQEVDAALGELKSLTDKPFGLNLHFFQPGAEEIVDIAIRHGVRAVSYGRGPSSQMIDKLKGAGIVCIPTVGALKHAVNHGFEKFQGGTWARTRWWCRAVRAAATLAPWPAPCYCRRYWMHSRCPW